MKFMQFSGKYPDAKPDEIIERNGDSLLRVEKIECCFMCKAETQFVSVAFEAGICSEECLTLAWVEVFTPPAGGEPVKEQD